jgi:lipid A 3-O-deacylase
MTRAHLVAAILPLFLLVVASPSFTAEELIPTRYSLVAGVGKTYSPNNDIDFTLVSAVALFDYDRVWPHRAPASLRFKVEGSCGLTTVPRRRVLISANMLALHFVDGLATDLLRPYIEAGIGLIYTDFQVEGQGLRINFNPQVGIGTELRSADGPPWYAAIRLQHVSNGGLDHDNRGINAVLLQVGRYF